MTTMRAEFPKAGSNSSSRRASCMQKLGMFKPLIHLMIGLFLYLFSAVMTIPVLTDVTLNALCPGEDECSQAIYLSGIQQVVAGIGTMLVTPVLGELSDHYGRKPLLLIPVAASILPMALFAYSRSRTIVYTNMILGTIVRMFAESGVVCLAFAYVGDCVEEHLRALGIGVLMGSLSFGYVMGISFARVLPEDYIFKAAAFLVVFAALYLKLFLPDTNSSEPLRPRGENDAAPESKPAASDSSSSSTPLLMRSTSSITNTVALFVKNKLLTQIGVIVFFSNLGDAGVQASLLYYLKAIFGFGKDQFAELMLIAGMVSVVSQLLVMPVFVHLFGEKKVLCIGLVASCVHALLYGVAWAPWVPYLCASMGIFGVFVFPCIGSIVSKTAGPEEQGKLQGFIAAVKSLATILSPLAATPLTALFLSDDAPLKVPGFSLICSGIVIVVAVIQALFLEPIPPNSLQDYKSSRFSPGEVEPQHEPLLV